ncbi:hypothetical protein KM1_041630 [Entamoeba histolytica HM-3:IMSS]|uniref:Uncharacterized protein n=4 Tax=Entamoeba histolytica TaxID=5759 RepID=C4M4U6_ENTH1|nr:hypothetical protein EHI_193420 [Entamoeba histolytica HM-1:IMSS]EAL46556.1 hypothetical protein EHI_193420 [Entamoeba histolytica HM-1:IMSS]EMS16135.1 hypothetical protein KM1_041630 [Entamoeba histolytica HM-3:IMSS]ENY62347.1 hypothetical protein EHI7A_062640 [Entamoeba histolytica HM-1:IMSS-A]GAT96403.1 hypothetical protein CL6EHI_193420 [Entamoeba histolytica]|eukprot:XP_651943.1 hypothetical protein EHI_193420 [Entamoeba histolytica HM-1:IMSS]
MLLSQHYHSIIPYLSSLKDAQNFSLINKKALSSIQSLEENPCYSVVFNGKKLPAKTSSLKQELLLFKGIHCFNCGNRIEQLITECSRFSSIRHSNGHIPIQLENKVIQSTYIPECPSHFSQLQIINTVFPSDISRLLEFSCLKKVVIFITEDEVISQLYQTVVSLSPSIKVILHFTTLSKDSLKLLQQTNAYLVSSDWRNFICYKTDKFICYLSELDTLCFKRIKQFLPHSIEIYSEPTFLIPVNECKDVNKIYSLKEFDGIQKVSLNGIYTKGITIELPMTITELNSDFNILNLIDLTQLRNATLKWIPEILNLPLLNTIKLNNCECIIDLHQCCSLENVQIEKCSSPLIILSSSIKFLVVEYCKFINSLTLPLSIEKFVIKDCFSLTELKNSSVVQPIGVTIKNCNSLKNVILNYNK